MLPVAESVGSDVVSAVVSGAEAGSEILHSIDGLDAKGNTALYDAIVYSLLQFEETPGRKAVVILTDGKDYGSRYQPSDCIRQARLLGVPVYLISLGAPPDLRQEPSQMRNVKIATETGGKVFYLTDLEHKVDGRQLSHAGMRAQSIDNLAILPCL